MKTYEVLTHFEHSFGYEVKANSKEEAEKIILKSIDEGGIDHAEDKRIIDTWDGVFLDFIRVHEIIKITD